MKLTSMPVLDNWPVDVNVRVCVSRDTPLQINGLVWFTFTLTQLSSCILDGVHACVRSNAYNGFSSVTNRSGVQVASLLSQVKFVSSIKKTFRMCAPC